MKYFLIVFFTCASFICQAVSKEDRQLDKLLEESKERMLNADYSKAYKTAHRALQLAEKNNDSEGKARAYLVVANIAYATENSKNLCYIYIQKAKQEPGFRSSPALQSKACSILGDIYFVRSMYDLTEKEYDKQLSFAKKIEDSERRAVAMVDAYLSLSGFYASKENTDTVWHYLTLMEATLQTVKEEKSYPWYVYFYLRRAGMFMSKKKLQNAQSDVEKAMALCQKYGEREELRNAVLLKLGDLEDAKGNKEKALCYYKQKLENDIRLKRKEGEFYMYSLLRDYIFKNKLEEKEAYAYLNKFQRLQEDLDVEKGRFTEMLLKDMAIEKENAYAKKSSIYLYAIIGVIFLSVVTGWLLWVKSRKRKKLLITKENALTEMNSATTSLKKQIEENKFNDLIYLAKNNNPEFLTLFKELYPEFISRLKNLDPQIKSNELSFCAMTYLNFSTKDIAIYTSVTVGAVEKRKHRLRKKYNIPSNIEFNSWMGQSY